MHDLNLHIPTFLSNGHHRRTGNPHRIHQAIRLTPKQNPGALSSAAVHFLQQHLCGKTVAHVAMGTDHAEKHTGGKAQTQQLCCGQGFCLLLNPDDCLTPGILLPCVSFYAKGGFRQD
jgi:hypothetical protein